MFETNCYLVHALGGNVLFDAPEGACAWLERLGVKLDLLILTHGHFDHVPDVAKLKRRYACQLGCSAETAPMISDPDFFKNFGFQLEIEVAEPDFIIEATSETEFLGANFEVLEVPGHCPGSLCFYSATDKLLFGGDVLFASGVGRWDLPGGDMQLLFRGIREKLYRLPDDVTVLPGHGPTTTIGRERRTNPFVSAAA
jgi:glyoxylase-like metal-dependent hydrolase (beta-lactamase superfamily II)